MTRSRPLHAALLAAALAITGCGLLQPTYQAARDDGSPGALVEYAFRGSYDGVSEAELRREIEDYLLDLSRTPQREGVAFDAAADLAERLRAAGHPDAKVEYAIERTAPESDQPEKVLVVFEVAQGPLVVVDPLVIQGNDAVDTATLDGLWQRQQAGVLGFGKPIFVVTEMEALAADIESFYHGRGYLGARVTPPTITRDEATSTARVEITVVEGERFRFAGWTVADALREALTGAGAPEPPAGDYTMRSVEDHALTLRAQLRRLGYPKPELEVRATVDAEAHTVSVELLGKPGRRAVIGEIAVEGNARTREGVILETLDLQPGARYDGAAEDDGLRRLYLTGLFTKVRLEHTWLDDERIRIGVIVEEDLSRSAETMVGYGSYERLRAGVRFDEKNVFGTGMQLTLLGRLSQRGFRTGVTVTEPSLLGSATALSVSGEFFRREEPSFTDEAFGTTTALSRRLLPGVTGRVGYTFRDHADAQAQVVDPGSRFVDYTEGRVFTELKSDQRDNPLFPKRGHEEFVLLEMVDDSLGADVSFLRARFGATGHFTLADPVRLVLRTEQGWLWPDQESAEIPLQERFYNGGESSVRSFRESRLGPLDVNGAPVGGEFRNIFSAELRAPVWKTLELSVFADAGNVGSRVQDFGLDDLRYALGAGLRLVLPIGPLRLDAAHNPDREIGEKDWVVHFSVGYPF